MESMCYVVLPCWTSKKGHCRGKRELVWFHKSHCHQRNERKGCWCGASFFFFFKVYEVHFQSFNFCAIARKVVSSAIGCLIGRLLTTTKENWLPTLMKSLDRLKNGSSEHFNQSKYWRIRFYRLLAESWSISTAAAKPNGICIPTKARVYQETWTFN